MSLSQSQPKAIHLKDYQPTPFAVDSLDLRISIFESETLVVARSQVRRTGAASAPLVWAGEELALLSVSLDGRTLKESDYTASPTELRIDNVPDSFVIETKVRIFPQTNTTLEGLYKSGDLFCTQCEAEGFRRITYFYDRPDVMTVYTTTIEASKEQYPVLLGNGNCTASGELEGGRHWVTWHDPFKKPSYLFAIVAGRLDCLREKFRTQSGRSVDLEIYAVSRDISKCQHAMNALKMAMRWDEEKYGLECDLDNFKIVAVSDFNAGAMENKGLNIFNVSLVLANKDIATDAGFSSIVDVIGHEYFHNWTGNRVTCRDWFQLCLKEGLTTFREQQFSEDMNSAAVNRIESVISFRAEQFKEDAGPMAHPVRPDSFIDISNFYTMTVYEKGAELCRMLKTLLGDILWRKGTDLYFSRHDGQAVTMEDFISCLAEAAQRDLSGFMQWYRQAGTPVITIQRRYSPEKKQYTLNVTQHTPPTADGSEKKPLLMPMLSSLIDKQGQEIPLRLSGEISPAGTQRVLELSQECQTFVFEDILSEPLPSLFRGFSAPVLVNIDLTNEELLFLLAHEGDTFNRFEAGQQLLTQTILSLADDLRNGRAPVIPTQVMDALFASVRHPALDDHFKALMLHLPELSVLFQKVKEIDVPSLDGAREFFRRSFAQRFESELVAMLDHLGNDAHYAYETKAVGRRSLKKTLLAYLSALEKDAHLQRAFELYAHSDNLTDRLTALQIIESSHDARRESLVSDFYQRWKHEELVVNKWFSVQAISRHTDVLKNVRRLTEHPDFHLTNPNRMRSLLAALAYANLSAFHHSSGEGYKIIVEQLAKLVRMNPQAASRLARGFSDWKKLEPKQRSLCKASLDQLAALENLPKDFFEVIDNIINK